MTCPMGCADGPVSMSVFHVWVFLLNDADGSSPSVVPFFFFFFFHKKNTGLVVVYVENESGKFEARD